jgi:hypothetical protein
LLASIAFASPFHKGASWEWKIIDPDSAAPLHRVAQVIDSLSDSARGIWWLRIADSVSQRDWDTAFLYEYSPGKGYWYRCSLRLPLEPRGFDPQIDLPDIADQGSEFIPWGTSCLVLNDSSNTHDYSREPPNSFAPLQGVIPVWYPWGRLEVWGADTILIPEMPWDTSLGWTHAKWWKLKNDGNFLRIGGPLQEWILVAKDGQKLTAKDVGVQKSSLVPPKGSVREWEWIEYTHSGFGSTDTSPTSKTFRDSTSTIRLRWEFLERPSDSSGWSRASVRETKTVDSRQSTTSEIALRWNLASGEQYSSSSGPSLKMADGFWADWADFRTDSGLIRRSKAKTSQIGRGGGWSSEYNTELSSYRVIRSAGGIDSMYEFAGTDSWGSGNFNLQSIATTVRLLQIDGTILRQPTPAVGVISANGAGIRSMDLKTLAVHFPTSKVELRDLLGKTEVLPLGEFGSTRSLHRLGLRFWEVRLPDGSVHHGTTFE